MLLRGYLFFLVRTLLTFLCFRFVSLGTIFSSWFTFEILTLYVVGFVFYIPIRSYHLVFTLLSQSVELPSSYL